MYDMFVTVVIRKKYLYKCTIFKTLSNLGTSTNSTKQMHLNVTKRDI